MMGPTLRNRLLMAIKGQIYDVTQSRMFYGPGGPYASFAGRDASRALAKMSFEPDDLTGDISGLGPFESEALQEWEYKFKSKYATVGTIKKTISVAEGDTATSVVTAERDIGASTTESNYVPEQKENGAINQASVVEKTREAPEIDLNTSSQEDIQEKAKELLDLDVTNMSSHKDLVEKPEEAPNMAVKNKSSAEDAVGPKGTPQVLDEKNTSKPEDATDKPKEAPDAVVMTKTTNHEDAGQPKETWKVDENDVSSYHDGEKAKETSDVEVKNA